MAYFLRSGQGVSEFVSIPQLTTATNVWSFYLDFKLSLINEGRDSLLISTSGGTTTRLIYRDGTTGDHTLTLRSGSNRDFDLTGIDLTERTKLEIVSDGTDLLLYLNDVLHETLAGNAHTISTMFDRLIEGPNSATTDLDLYEAYFDSGFTQERSYSPSVTGGTGSTLEDTISAENGTLTGFPSDDSQWISYVASPSITLTSGNLEPGKAITGTYANFTAAPTALSVTDEASNSISSASEITDLVIDDTAKTFAFTMPARITSGTGQTLLRTGVTLEVT